MQTQRPGQTDRGQKKGISQHSLITKSLTKPQDHRLLISFGTTILLVSASNQDKLLPKEDAETLKEARLSTAGRWRRDQRMGVMPCGVNRKHCHLLSEDRHVSGMLGKTIQLVWAHPSVFHNFFMKSSIEASFNKSSIPNKTKESINTTRKTPNLLPILSISEQRTLMAKMKLDEDHRVCRFILGNTSMISYKQLHNKTMVSLNLNVEALPPLH